MKSIIQGKRYDTDKAQLLGAVETDGLTKSDFRYWEAGLYKTPGQEATSLPAPATA